MNNVGSRVPFVLGYVVENTIAESQLCRSIWSVVIQRIEIDILGPVLGSHDLERVPRDVHANDLTIAAKFPDQIGDG